MSSAVRNVLVVDDDERIVAMYKRCFDAGWRVHGALDVGSALALIRAQPLDAAVVDLHLGPTSSISVIRALRGRNPAARIMVVSGYLTTEATVVAVRAGADVVVDKPIRPREVMKKLLEGGNEDINLGDTPTLAEAIDSHIARVYADCDGNVSETARRLGIYRSSLQRRLRRNAVKRLD
jgi:two-component system response regulator RegA